MSQNIKTLLISFYIILFSNIVFAAPSFTNPILATAGHTLSRGHTNRGIIYGVWIPAVGKNTSHFPTDILTMNLFW